MLAEEELAGIRILAAEELSYAMCRSKLAEIVEKILKAELIRTGWFLEKTHDLLKLAGELQTRSSDLLPQIRPLCIDLAQVYFTARYPGFDLDDPNWPDFREKVAQAEKLLQKVKARTNPPAIPPGPVER